MESEPLLVKLAFVQLKLLKVVNLCKDPFRATLRTSCCVRAHTVT